MAIGTITRPTPNPDFANGNRKQRTRDVQLTSGANYTTGGETITAAMLGMRRIESVYNAGIARTASGASSAPIAISYQTDGSIKLLQYGSAGSEQVAGSNMSAFFTRLVFIGY